MSGSALALGQSKIVVGSKIKAGYLGLAAILLFKLIWQGVILQQGFVSISGDDFLRSLIAYQWAKSPFFAATDFGFASVLWLPQHFWLVGSLLRIYPDLWLVPALVSLFFSMASLIMLYHLVNLLFDEKVGLVTVLLAGFLPWQIWLSVAGIAATLYHFLLFTGIYFALRWSVSRANIHLLPAAITFLLLTMVRPEGWFYAAVFSLYLLFYLYQNWRSWKHKMLIILACLLPGCFILYWFYFNYVTYGNIFQFVKFSRDAYQQEVSEVDSLLVRLVKYPVMMFIVSPLLLVFLMPGLVHALTHLTPNVKRYLLFFGGGMALLMLLSIMGAGTNTAPQRYVVSSVILSTPLIAAWLFAITKRVRWLLFTGLALFLLFNLTLSLIGFSREYADAAEVGRYLRNRWETGRLAPGDEVASEKTFRAYVSKEAPDYLEEVFLITDHWTLQVMSNRPEAFAETRWDPKPVVSSTEYPSLQAYLGQENVKVIVLKTRSLIKHIPADYALTETIGSYLLFTYQEQKPLPLPAAQPIQQPIQVDYDDHLSLVGYTLDNSFLPKYVTLFWTLQQETDVDYRMRLKLVNTQDETIRYATEFHPYYEVYPTGAWPAGQIVAERVDFPRPVDFVPGDYWLKISVLSSVTDRQNEPDQEVTLGPLTLSATKRGVFKYILREKKIDVGLLLKVMASL